MFSFEASVNWNLLCIRQGQHPEQRWSAGAKEVQLVNLDGSDQTTYHQTLTHLRSNFKVGAFSTSEILPAAVQLKRIAKLNM